MLNIVKLFAETMVIIQLILYAPVFDVVLLWLHVYDKSTYLLALRRGLRCRTDADVLSLSLLHIESLDF